MPYQLDTLWRPLLVMSLSLATSKSWLDGFKPHSALMIHRETHPSEELNMNLESTVWRVLLIASVFVTAPLASAQQWPTRVVKLVVPYAPGGGTDLVARMLATKLTEQVGGTFIVENRPGAGGTVGSSVVARAAPDGYTLLVTAPEMSIDPSLRVSLPYDVLKDFAPISQLTSGPYILAVNPSVPIRTVEDLIVASKREPNKFNYGSSGTGTINHLKGELLQQMTGISWQHVPYKGSGPSILAAASGEVQFVFASTTALGPFIQSGRLRGVGVTGPQRYALLPDVPTLAESGVPGYNVTGWYALFAPAGTPPDILRQIHAATARAFADPDMKAKLATMGNEPLASSPAEFSAFLRSEMDKWAHLIKSNKIEKIE